MVEREKVDIFAPHSRVSTTSSRTTDVLKRGHSCLDRVEIAPHASGRKRERSLHKPDIPSCLTSTEDEEDGGGRKMLKLRCNTL